MKRSSSEIDIPPLFHLSESEDFRPDITPPPFTSPSKSKKAKSVTKTPTPSKRIKKESNVNGGNDQNGEWDSDKKALMMDTIIAAGYKSTDLDTLAQQLGLSKRQVINQLQPGRKGSLREKAVQAVRGA